MKITVSVDKDLLDEAKEFTDISRKDDLVQEALRTFIRQKKAARYLIELGGTMPNIKPIPRRRPTWNDFGEEDKDSND